MERPLASISTELLEGIITQNEECIEHLVGYARQELQLRLAAIAIDDSKNERLATIRDRIALIYEDNATGVVDALIEPLPPDPVHIDERWIVPGSN